MLVLCAPAGFGKTATLAHLHRRVEAQGAPVAWLTLDGADDTESFSEMLRRALAGALACDVGEGLDALLERIAAAPGHALFLDDVHCASPEVRQAVSKLLAHAPKNLRVAMAGRDVQGLRLARLSVAGRAELIGPDAMRISAQALAEIEPHGGEREFRKIVELTDGWPAAAIALASSLRAQPRNAALTSDHVVSAGLVKFVREEIAPELSEDLAHALRMQALLPGVPAGPEAMALTAAIADGPLSGLIRRREDGALTLNPIVEIWARHDLARRAAHERASVTERAARLALAAGRPAEGFAIALDGGDAQLALDIVLEAGAVLLWITHGFETVRSIVERAGEVLVEQTPRLQLMASVIDLKRGEVARAEGRFTRALRMPLDDDGERDAGIVRVALAIYGCRDISKTDWRVLEEKLQASNDSAAMRSYTTSAAAILKLQSGQLDDAERVAEAAKVDARFAQSSYAIMYLDFHLAGVALARGQAATMREQMQAALARWRSEFSSDTGAQAVAAAFAAEVELELGRPMAARARFLPTMKRLGNLDAWFEVYAAAYETAARLDMLEFGAASAIKKLGHFAELLRSRGLQRVATHLNVVSAVLAGEARLRGEGAMLGTAADADIAGAVQDVRYWREREARALAEAYALMAQGQARQAAQRLAADIEVLRDMQCRRAELRLRALSVAAYDAAGQEKQARRAMLEALALGRMTGYRRSLIDSGGAALVRRLSKLGAGVSPTDRRFADMVLKQVERQQASNTNVRLTAREQEVLAALNVARSDKQIARLLGVSEHAVRFHLKNLYRKLRVHSRTDALAQAHAEGHL